MSHIPKAQLEVTHRERPTIRPRRCISVNPRGQTIVFCGECIHLPSIAMRTNLSMGYLSRVFSRKRNPSLRSCELIAKALDMGLEEFLLALRGHVQNRYRPMQHYGEVGLQRTSFVT